jgi:hypothetical protein
MRWRLLVVAAFLAASLGCGRRESTRGAADPNEDVRRLMRDKVEGAHGRSLNDMSPETAGTLSARLRVGMTHAELSGILAEKNRVDPKTGAHIATLEFGRGIVWLQDQDGKPLRDEKGELRADADKWYCLFHVRDANLKVVFDKEDRILSWSVEPLRHR